MAERVPIPTDAAEIGWRTGASPPAHTSTKPAGAKQISGYDTNDPYPSAEANWRYELYGDMFDWLDAFVPREWSDVYEGIAESDEQERFWVAEPLVSGRRRGAEVWNVNPATIGSPVAIATDGVRAYAYSTGAVDIEALDPIDGSQLWAVTPTNTANCNICSDGANLVTSGVVASPGLVLLDPSDGTETGRGGTAYNMGIVRSNGVFAVGMPHATGVNDLVFFNISSGTPVQNGTVTLGAAPGYICVDDSTVYVVIPSTQTIEAYNLTTRAQTWTQSLPFGSTPSAGWTIETDGDRIYVAGDRANNVNVAVIDRQTGATLDTLDLQWVVGNTVHLLGLSIDDRYFYTMIDEAAADYGVAVEKYPPYAIVERIADTDPTACDGVSVYGFDYGTPTTCRRLWMNDTAKQFVIPHTGANASRRPFFNLAVPVE